MQPACWGNKEDMSRAPIAAVAGIAASITIASAAVGTLTVSIVAGGHAQHVRAVEVGDAWYVSADDVVHALGGGASFDRATRTLYASAGDRTSQMHTVDKLGGGFATDGTVSARLVSVKRATSFQGNAPDPGAHFVMAVIQLKNVTRGPVDLYRVETSLVAGGKHINDGQFYDLKGNDLPLDQTAPGQTVTYLDVFELNDGVAVEYILVHPPFAPTTSPVDMVLKL